MIYQWAQASSSYLNIERPGQWNISLEIPLSHVWMMIHCSSSRRSGGLSYRPLMSLLYLCISWTSGDVRNHELLLSLNNYLNVIWNSNYFIMRPKTVRSVSGLGRLYCRLMQNINCVISSSMNVDWCCNECNIIMILASTPQQTTGFSQIQYRRKGPWRTL